jgi:hypothetical protein
MDYKSFRRTIVYSVVSEFLVHFDSSVSRWSSKADLNPEVIRLRASLTFARASVLVVREAKKGSKSIQRFDEAFLKEHLQRQGIISDQDEAWNLWRGLKRRYVYGDFVKPVFVLMGLLWDKQDTLLTNPFELPGLPAKYNFTLQERDVKPLEALTEPMDPILIGLKQEFKERPLLLDADIPLWISPEAFDRVNAVLARTVWFCMDPDKCRKFYDEVTKEIAEESSGDFLLHGL